MNQKLFILLISKRYCHFNMVKIKKVVSYTGKTLIFVFSFNKCIIKMA